VAQLWDSKQISSNAGDSAEKIGDPFGTAPCLTASSHGERMIIVELAEGGHDCWQGTKKMAVE
jgi:hypothetical protein